MAVRNPTCGCKACEVSLWCHPVCRCVPQAICVTMSEPSGDCACKARDPYAPAAAMQVEWDETSESYHGTLYCGNLEIDVEFTFERTGEQNYFCLESECLGLVGAKKLCEAFAKDANCGNPTFDFDVEVSGCGDPYCGSARISTAKSDRISLEPECGDCQSCNCFSRCLCVSYADEPCFEIVEVCWDTITKSWHTSINCPSGAVSIELYFEENPYTGACELVLETDAAVSNPMPACLSCPDIDASWTFKKSDGTEASVSVSSVKCRKCTVSECCEETGGLPTTVYVSLRVVSGKCAAVDGLSIELNWNDSISCWYGSEDVYGCGEVAVDLCCAEDLGPPLGHYLVSGLKINDYGFSGDCQLYDLNCRPFVGTADFDDDCPDGCNDPSGELTFVEATFTE